MQSINDEVNLLHQTYCVAMGMDKMPLIPYFERQYYEVLKLGITCEDVRLVVGDRQRRVRAGVRHPECLHIRNLFGSDEALGNLMMEASYLKAIGRLKPINTPLASALRATGREPEKQAKDAVPIGKVIDEMRKAAG